MKSVEIWKKPHSFFIFNNLILIFLKNCYNPLKLGTKSIEDMSGEIFIHESGQKLRNVSNID